MSKFKTTFTLKQHTPIIHFQSEQSGATLRATELKPKFDRFLKEHAFNGEFPEEFLIPKQDGALDYKVKIEPNISQSEEIPQRDPLFFANMGDGEDKKFKNPNRIFKIEFFTFNTKLKSIIEDSFEAFLANNNFGTRQSKGFGSFYINKKEFNIDLIPYRVYSFSSSNWKKDIGLLYQFLRQGINLPNREGTRFYSKPAIFSYAKSKSWTWDKKAIKHTYFNSQLESQEGEAVRYQSNQEYLLRDLFGLSSEQEWKIPYRAKISKENKDIERFKSPITFKVVENKVYFWANNTIDNILDKEFEIKNNKRGELKLKTPPNFDFNEFFAFAFNINLSTHIENQYHSQDEFVTLERVIKSIKSNL